MASTSTVVPSNAGSSKSGRTSTSTSTSRSPEKSFSFGQTDDIGGGATEHAQLVGLDGLTVVGVEPLAHGVLEHGGAADALVDDRRRDLALAEPGDLHVLCDVLVSVRDARLELIGRDRDVQLHARGRELLDSAVDHACSFSSYSTARQRGS